MLILICFLGVGSANVPELNAISSGSDYVHHVGGAGDLHEIVSHLTKNFCEETDSK